MTDWKTTYQEIRQTLDHKKDDHLNTLFTLLRQPSISTLNIGVRECAELLLGIMKDSGINADIMETKGHPVVYGEIIDPKNTKTILFYGHYDVQPPEPLELWESDPFVPTIRDGKIFGRGTGDNKGQLIAHVLAVKTLLEQNGSLPVNVKFLYEGEEEKGSVNLASFVAEHKDLLKADIAYTADGPMEGDGQPTVTLGNRGLLYVELNALGANRDNHSGNKGNIAPDPAMTLLNLIRTMVTDDGEVLIDGFYDGIIQPTPEEKEQLRSIPFFPEKTAKVVGLDSLSMTNEEYYTNLCFKPTFTIAGFLSGYTGEGTKTIIPGKAKVKLDMRLAPNQDPAAIYSAIEKHVSAFDSRCQITVKNLSAVKPSKTPLSHPLVQKVIESVETAYEIAPVVLPALGGTGPMFVFTDILNIPSVTVPYANVDEDNHAPNENMGLKEFYWGIQASSSAILNLGLTD
ncbi:M20/M25/M40 family metallo-hydrolase [Alkalibacterium olivapovliticus]|uniref:Acetylornithine deacetylase/succinyl-diaminopimelate desuccinylase-like protein n=1 Tax=Alkalibacterium olivapovliticus TaxID=99907 RepID=A0A2T0W6M6_9LACT|nr:M20/M25/M40 family metallo-hydrolase [Alkalibacterium olivapovliticus]PRY82303.1 acetylornithine deacetylase/succinyl-diaminopimelate desuccinylase-like protein [Alkalibacterium olivapovliticus]